MGPVMCPLVVSHSDYSTQEDPSRRPLVLIVDDDPDARTIYAEILGSRGFRTIEAADGEIAIEMAVEGHPDVILMDGSMPSMSGHEAALRLKGDRRTRAIPIVILSGSNTPPPMGASETLERSSPYARYAPYSPWDAYMTKPSSIDNIEATLRSVLSATESGVFSRRSL
jgi:two-component system, cell cycle response regulator DivK